MHITLTYTEGKQILNSQKESQSMIKFCKKVKPDPWIVYAKTCLKLFFGKKDYKQGFSGSQECYLRNIKTNY